MAASKRKLAPKKEWVVLSIKVTKEDFRALEDIAIEQGHSYISHLGREIITSYIAANKTNGKKKK